MLNKALQTKFYNFLATRWGVAIFVVGLFFSFNSILQLLTAILEEDSLSSTIPHFQPFNQKNCNFKSNFEEEIDVVFTWVNGSDPRHKDALQALKLQKFGQIYRICNSTELAEEANCTKDEETMSRFTDNEELRYSLRSIEKNANWIRNIYLVTNGQIPYWLNLSNPRLSVVTHEQIFANHSHLPTFSSPAIEANLHRIPGLARKFIYFNDDTMIGDTIYPDDFETKSNGQKVFLAWGVPNCAEGCPSSWIGDGFCDQACNTTACDFDGGDCANVTHSNYENGGGGGHATGGGYTGFGNSNAEYCSTGCPNSWIGDKFCDRTCRVADCGFDAGDCDISELSTGLHATALDSNSTFIRLPPGLLACYFNLSQIVGEGKVVDGSHDTSTLIRTATISQKHKIITLTFNRKVPQSLVSLQVTYESLEGSSYDFSFNVSHSTGNDSLLLSSPIESSQSNPLPSSFLSSSVFTADEKNNSQNENNEEKKEEKKEEGLIPPKQQKDEREIDSRKEEEKLGKFVTVSKVDFELNEVEKPQLEDESISRKETIKNSLGEMEEVVENSSSSKKENIAKLKNQFNQVLNNLQGNSEKTSKKSMRNLMELNEDQKDNENESEFESFLSRFSKRTKLDKKYLFSLLYKLRDSNSKDWKQKLERKLIEMDDISIEEKYRLDLSRISVGGEMIWPWELEDNEEQKDNKSKNTGRKLKDNYGDSLKFVNSLMNAAFGSSARKVPAHMPHFLNLDVLEDLHKFWPEKWNETSSHQFRSGEDMQFAFSYFYFMIHQLNEFNLTNVWTYYLDTNKDGFLNTNEVRTLAAHLGPLPLANDSVIVLKEQLLNCSEGGLISLAVLQSCEPVLSQVKEHFGAKPKNRHELLDTEEVAFLMIGLNHTNVENWLDGVREKRHKFICLNDNINYSDPRAPQVLKVVKNFYQSLFPLKSSFELPDGVENSHLHLDELPEPYLPFGQKKTDPTIPLQKQRNWIIFTVLSLFGCAACVAFWRTKGGDETRKRREKRFLVMMNTA